MRYRRLGECGLKISELSLGTWQTHNSHNTAGAVQVTRRAYELGVNLFDTANEYQDGAAEEVLGQALAVFPRETYLIASKVFSPVGTKGPLERGLSRKHIFAQIDKSLTRLRTDHLDLYQCHRYDPEVPLTETIMAMNDLIRSGKVLYWGVSEWTAQHVLSALELCEKHNWPPPVSNQIHYSALWRTHEDQTIPTCEKHGIGILAFSSLAHGVLSGKYTRASAPPAGTRGAEGETWISRRYLKDDILERVQEFRSYAETLGCTSAQLALLWCLRKASVTSTIIGSSRAGQLEENVAIGDFEVTEDDLEKAGEILRPVALT